MDEKKIIRPIPDDRVGYKNWVWISPLRKVKETDQYTQYERDATLSIDEKEYYLGAWHSYSDGKKFTRIYLVGTNLSKCGYVESFSRSLGQWNLTKSSLFSFKDFRSFIQSQDS